MKRRKAPQGYERHHRHPRSRKKSYKGGNISEISNISIVSVEDHRAYHRLFGNMTPPEMAKMLNDTWASPDFYFVAFPRKRKTSQKRRKRFYCSTCNAEILKYLQPWKGDET